jgi:hypothetical protein
LKNRRKVCPETRVATTRPHAVVSLRFLIPCSLLTELFIKTKFMVTSAFLEIRYKIRTKRSANYFKASKLKGAKRYRNNYILGLGMRRADSVGTAT